MYEWAAVGCNGRTFHQDLPPDWNCHVRVGCNGRTFQELPPGWNCHIRVGFNGLQWQDFSSGFTPWLKLPCKSELQWEDFSSGFTPWLKLPWKCGLQWEEFSGIIPLTEIAMYEWAARGCNRRTFHQDLPTDWNCHVRVGCNGSTFQE